MNFDYFAQRWTIEMNFKPGKYFYKFIVDGEWVCNEDDPINNDLNGNINNYLEI